MHRTRHIHLGPIMPHSSPGLSVSGVGLYAPPWNLTTSLETAGLMSLALHVQTLTKQGGTPNWPTDTTSLRNIWAPPAASVRSLYLNVLEINISPIYTVLFYGWGITILLHKVFRYQERDVPNREFSM